MLLNASPLSKASSSSSQEALYGSMARAQRRDVHAAHARYLEEAPGPDAGPTHLALHWRQAEEAERALPHMEAAAAAAVSRGAMPEVRP
eukprot:tig00020693_g13021.t1